MSGKSRVALALVSLSACSADDRSSLGHTLAAQTGASTVFTLAARQRYQLPPQIPDELLEVPDLFGPPGSKVSLRTGEVIGAWTTAPLPSGDPASLVYRCRPDADGDSVWSVAPDTGLAPLGIDPADLAAALPFAAEHTLVEPAGLYLYAPTGPAWTVTGPGLRAQLIASVDGVEPLAPYGDVPLCRYQKAVGVTSGVTGAPTLDRADYVLRLNTQGGVGPDLVGAPCDPGSLDVRSEVSADFYFVSLPGSVGPRVP